MYEKIREKFGRDAEIAKAYRAGILRSELAKRYGVSRAAIDQAIEKAEAEAKRARNIAAFVHDFAITSRMNQQWPCERLFAGLGFDARSRRAMTEYCFECRGKREISMRELMNALIPRLTGQEKAGDLYAVLPAYRIRGVGKYCYSRMIGQLNRIDLGLVFKLEWEARKTWLRALLAQWKMDVMGDELAEVR
jgi:hypothetical protein